MTRKEKSDNKSKDFERDNIETKACEKSLKTKAFEWGEERHLDRMGFEFYPTRKIHSGRPDDVHSAILEGDILTVSVDKYETNYEVQIRVRDCEQNELKCYKATVSTFEEVLDKIRSFQKEIRNEFKELSSKILERDLYHFKKRINKIRPFLKQKIWAPMGYMMIPSVLSGADELILDISKYEGFETEIKDEILREITDLRRGFQRVSNYSKFYEAKCDVCDWSIRDVDSADVEKRKKKHMLTHQEGLLFSWDKIPGNDEGKLIEFLTHRFRTDWVRTAKKEKIDDGKTIRVTSGDNFLSLKLNFEKNTVQLKIDDGRTDDFIIKMENGELNIYHP